MDNATSTCLTPRDTLSAETTAQNRWKSIPRTEFRKLWTAPLNSALKTGLSTMISLPNTNKPTAAARQRVFFAPRRVISRYTPPLSRPIESSAVERVGPSVSIVLSSIFIHLSIFYFPQKSEARTTISSESVDGTASRRWGRLWAVRGLAVSTSRRFTGTFTYVRAWIST